MRGALVRLALAAVWIGWSVAALAQERAPSETAVLHAFGRIAFGNEHSAEAEPRLQKWVQPLRWRAYGRYALDEAEERFLLAHLARLQRFTGLDVAPAASEWETNFVILFVREARYEEVIRLYLAENRRHLLPRLAATTCVGLLRNHRKTHEIVYAASIIPVERARRRGLLESCIAEETTQVLGLPNDSDDVPGTLFDDSSPARDLTPLDELLLQLLYRPEIRPGMTRPEALAAARTVLPMMIQAR